jgi:DUF1365 family protein
MLRNQICDGWVVHRRLEPAHEFSYRVGLLCLDVSASQESRWLSSTRRWWPLRFGSREWLSGAVDTLDTINQRLAEKGYPPCQQAFALGQPRSFGWYFNPVCFYFCVGESGLDYVLAEINNTPWNEKYSYVLDARSQQGDLEFNFPKRFHVSPFMPMDMEYSWRVKVESDRIEIAMQLYRDGLECFFAGLYLKNQELNEAGLRQAVLRYPLQNLRTLGRIYWQALRLYLKRAPFHSHPESPKEVLPT